MLSVTQNIKTQRILFREKGSLREEPVGGRRVFIDDNRLFLGQRERTAFALWVLMGEQDFIIWKDGEPDLAPWRKAKLEQDHLLRTTKTKPSLEIYLTDHSEQAESLAKRFLGTDFGKVKKASL